MQRISSIDFLKFLLAVGVTLAHAGLIHGKIEEWSYLVGYGLLRSLVPTFAVLSGFCFYAIKTRNRVRPWLVALLRGYALGAMFYAPLWVRGEKSLGDLAWDLVWGPMHLWYIVALIQSALLLLFFLRIGEKRGSGLRPAAIAALVLGLVGVLLSYLSFLGLGVIPMEVMRNGLTMFPFAVIGYWLAAYVAAHGREALPRAHVLWLGVALVFGLKLLEAWFSMAAYGLSAPPLPELPLLAYPAAALLFLGFLRLDLPSPRIDLSLCSVSIYFLHLFVLAVLRHVGIHGIGIPTLLGVLLPCLMALAGQRMWLALRKRGRPGKDLEGPVAGPSRGYR